MTSLRTFQDPGQSLDAWLSQFDEALTWMENLSRSDPEPIPLGDDRQRCEAWAGQPGHEALCQWLAKDGTRWCRIHQKHRRQVQLFGPEQ